MSISKQYLKTKPVCKVTFKLNKEKSKSVDSVHIVGDFNGWNPQATPMKKRKNGDFAATVDLDRYKEYQFRYLKNEKEWVNDTDADKFVPSPFGEDNSVIVV